MIKMRSESRQDLLSVHNYASFFLDRLRTKGYAGMTDGWLGTNNIVHFDFVFFPTCTGDHWFLVTINNREKSITIYHSKLVEGRANAAFNYICTFLANKHMRLNGTPMRIRYKLRVHRNIPVQNKGWTAVHRVPVMHATTYVLSSKHPETETGHPVKVK